jgi:hypothetical protein
VVRDPSGMELMSAVRRTPLDRSLRIAVENSSVL